MFFGIFILVKNSEIEYFDLHNYAQTHLSVRLVIYRLHKDIKKEKRNKFPNTEKN